MPRTSLQSQIQQLQAQLKLSQSPKQSKMLQSAIARLEEKLKKEAAEQARLKAETEAKAEQGAQVQKEGEAIAKKKTGIMPPKKEQELSDGTILKAVPGQGYHLFYWKVWGEIHHQLTAAESFSSALGFHDSLVFNPQKRYIY